MGRFCEFCVRFCEFHLRRHCLRPFSVIARFCEFSLSISSLRDLATPNRGNPFCHSERSTKCEAKNLFFLNYEILRYAQYDKID
ncbi:hypothetical protein ACWIUD_01645 [Helicobacter sp. 23-1044]